MVKEESLELLTSLNQHLERTSPNSQTEVESQTLHVDTIRRQQFYVGVVHKADPVQVDHPQVGCMRLDLAEIDHFIDLLFFFITQLESTWRNKRQLICWK